MLIALIYSACKESKLYEEPGVIKKVRTNTLSSLSPTADGVGLFGNPFLRETSRYDLSAALRSGGSSGINGLAITADGRIFAHASREFILRETNGRQFNLLLRPENEKIYAITRDDVHQVNYAILSSHQLLGIA